MSQGTHPWQLWIKGNQELPCSARNASTARLHRVGEALGQPTHKSLFLQRISGSSFLPFFLPSPFLSLKDTVTDLEKKRHTYLEIYLPLTGLFPICYQQLRLGQADASKSTGVSYIGALGSPSAASHHGHQQEAGWELEAGFKPKHSGMGCRYPNQGPHLFGDFFAQVTCAPVAWRDFIAYKVNFSGQQAVSVSSQCRLA